MTLSVGVVGTGMIGQDHIRRLTRVLSGVKITAVADIDRKRAAAAAPAGDVTPSGPTPWSTSAR